MTHRRSPAEGTENQERNLFRARLDEMIDYEPSVGARQPSDAVGALTRYLDNGRMPIDNNRMGNQI